MMTIDRTCKVFAASVRQALPGVRLSISISENKHGQSRYIFIHLNRVSLKVRISDHPIDMNRMRSGECDLHLAHNAKPRMWSVWLSKVARTWALENSGLHHAVKDADVFGSGR